MATTYTEIAPQETTTGLAARIGWAALICATLYVCYFSHLGAIGFVGPDEPRYAWIARDMAETGDWVTPRLYGKPWFEKPPLYYWGAATCFKLFGVSEAPARLPSAISALLATLALAWLAWRIYGAETARWLLLLLPTTVGMIGFSHAAATDMPFSAMLTIAMVCAAVLVGLVPEPSKTDAAPDATPSQNEHTAPRRRWLALILFGIFLGLAVLAKGPAAIILSGGAVFFWALFTKRWRDAFRLFHPAAIIAFCATALPWYILCARRNPDFFRVFIIEHNFKRFLTPEFQHIQPFWFYLPILLAAFLPWTAGMLAALVLPRSRSPINAFFLSFGLFPILFFTISRSKLPGYILPAVPPIAWLLANTTRALLEKPLRKKILVLSYALTLIAVAIAVDELAAHHALGQDLIPAHWIPDVSLPLFVAAIVGIVFCATRYSAAVPYAIQIGMLLAAWALSLAVARLDSEISARGVLNANHTDVQSLRAANVFVYDVSRGIHYGLNYYLRREIPEWTSGEQGPVFSSWKGQSLLKAQGYDCQYHLVFPAAFLCKWSGDLPRHPPGSGKPQ